MAGALLIAVTGPTTQAWYDRFRAQAGGRDVRCWPDIGDPAGIAYAGCWRAPRGLLKTLPNLKAIFSLGAGVDHVMADPDLPALPVARAVHPDLSMRMTEYVVLHALIYHRRQRLYDAQQRERIWHGHPQPAASDVAVGVMGLGAIGSEVARALKRIGFRVAGWSRSAKRIDGIESFSGAAGLDSFLARTEILACLLPHTAATEGILNLGLFRRLKRDGALGAAYLINAARGPLHVEPDVVAALDEGALAGATLDVFATEPLPADSPLWAHPKITITPHNAGDLDPRLLVAGVFEQIARFERGEPLANVVERARGY